MGSCFSKKKKDGSVAISVPSEPTVEKKPDILTQKVEKELLPAPAKEEKEEEALTKKKEEEDPGTVKKEVFIIKHRKSHERGSQPPPQQDDEKGNNNNMGVRTSSCTKEEVDAILIQCGRLSRSNSSGTGKTSLSARKYSGSKRSYDFDHDEAAAAPGDDDNDSKKKSSDDEVADRRQHRQRHRQSPSSSRHSSAQGRRRTPSRERDQQQQQQRSGSRERSSSSGRRVSRSPGRRSDQNSNNPAVVSTSTTTNRPAKMVSVPATVMEKSNSSNVSEPAQTTVRRISVKRNVGAASPRTQSPAKTNAANQQQPCLSRSSSRKAEHSPYRRNPLSDIDPNCLAYPQSAACNNNNTHRNKEMQKGDCLLVNDSAANVLCQAPTHKENVETVAQGANYKAKINKGKVTSGREQQLILEEAKTQIPVTGTGAESQKPQNLTRSRSSRRSRDLDFINSETLSNPAPSYTALLLEDIQNFHQKNAPSFSLPACVTKACSILEAVADLNSTTSSTISEDRRTSPVDDLPNGKNNKSAYNYNFNPLGKKISEGKEPFVESEVVGSDDLMEPSFHKYVTVRRGGAGGGRAELDDQESSGSNSYVGGNSQLNWSFSSSTWEPNSADSTDRWTSEDNHRHTMSESSRKGFSSNTKDTTGIGRGRVVSTTAGKSGGLYTTAIPVTAVASK